MVGTCKERVEGLGGEGGGGGGARRREGVFCPYSRVRSLETETLAGGTRSARWSEGLQQFMEMRDRLQLGWRGFS